MAEGPLSFATGYKQYDDLLGQAIADNQARLSAAPTSPLSNVDPVMLSLAQGLLSPTKTGGFGESLGIAANAIQAPLAAMQKQKLDAQGKIDELQLARAKLAMEAPYQEARAAYYQAGGPRGGGTSIGQQRLLIGTKIKRMQDNEMNPERLGLSPEEWEIELTNLLKEEQRLGEAEAAGDVTPEASKANPAGTDSGPSTDAPKDDTVPPRPDAKRGANPETGKEGWFIPDPNRKGYYLEVQ